MLVRKEEGMLRWNNASVHKNCISVAAPGKKLNQPFYSLDLAPSDYCLS
jgi:hypothetical protein